MIILAFDTSMGACSAAITQRKENVSIVLSSRFEVMQKGHAERLLPMIKEVMDEACLGFGDLDKIAVTQGPGTFTGVRIGVAAARGLSLASQKPVVSCTSLQLLALTWLAAYPVPKSCATLGVVMDARRGDVFLQRFDLLGQAKSEAQILSLNEASELLLGEIQGEDQIVLIGSAKALLADVGDKIRPEDCDGGSAELLPDAQYLAQIAHNLEAGAQKISPLYLRAADAKTQAGKSIARK